MPWFALYVKPKNEKKVVERLTQLGMEGYCPMVKQVKLWSDRKKKVEVPLISSYVFVNLEEKERSLVFQVPGVLRYLFWLGKPAIITESEIAQLKRALQSTFSDFRMTAIAPGESIVIPCGPFRGKEGIVNFENAKGIQVTLKEFGYAITLMK